MAAPVRLPKLGENVVEGTVGAWRVREGDQVRRDEPLVEIITSKATFEIVSPADGILRRILAPEKSNVPVGYALALIGAPDEALPDVSEENERLVAEFRRQARPGAQAAAPTEGAIPHVLGPRGIRATPGARRLAREAGIELADLPVSPERDVIREEDVRRYIAQRRDSR